MKILQLLPAGAIDSLVWEDALALSKLLRDMDVQTGIYADPQSPYLSEHQVKAANHLPRLSGEDVLLYHKCPNTFYTLPFSQYPCRKLLRFHGNIPPRDWKPYHPLQMDMAEQSLRELCNLADEMDYCITDTTCQSTLLETLHYQTKITTCPPLLTFSDFAKTPDSQIMAQYEGDGYENFLFSGTLTPYQKVEDVIRIFASYQRNCQAKARLFILGSLSAVRPYGKRLVRYVQGLNLEEQVIFSDKLSQAEQLAYFHLADFYLDMSEHEGFRLPLLQAMYFGIPIIAKDTSEHQDLLGGSGLCIGNTPNFPIEAALLIQHTQQDIDLRREVLAGQRRRQKDFAFSHLRKQMENALEDFLATVPPKPKKSKFWR